MITKNPQDERQGRPSASSMERVHFCAGSEQLIRTIPPEQRNKKTDVSEAGDRVHAALEAGDISDLDMTEGEIAEALKKLEIDAYERWMAEVIAPAYAGKLIPTPIVIREARMWFSDQDGEQLASAKPDVVYVIENFAICVDFKSGFKAVTAAQRNYQLKTQALTVFSEYFCENIRVAAAQHRLRSMFTAADYDVDALYNAAAELKFDLWKAEQPDAQRVPGQYCDYCPAKNHCREVNVYSAMPLVIAANNATPSTIPKEELLAQVAQMQPADLAFIYRRAGIISKVLDAVKDRLKGFTAEELASLGLKLEEGRNQAEVKDPAGLFAYLQAEGLVKESEVMSCVKVSLGAYEKLALPRLVDKAKAAGRKSNQADEKKELRSIIQINDWIDFEASKTSSILVEI